MPDLGKYAVEVLSAYAGSMVLIGGLIVMSIAQRRAAKRALDEIEEEQGDG